MLKIKICNQNTISYFLRTLDFFQRPQWYRGYAYCCCLLLLLTATAYCCCLLLLLTAAAYCYCLLLLLTAAAYCYCLLLLLTAAAYCYCLLLLPTAAAYCCCYCLLLLPTAINPAFTAFVNSIQEAPGLSVFIKFSPIKNPWKPCFFKSTMVSG